jgi:CSLREA domain-containing protein
MIRLFRLLLALLLAAAPLGISSTPAAARPTTTYTVNFFLADLADPTPNDGVCDALPGMFFPGDQCTLRAAIQTANGVAGADTVIVPAGVYTLTLTGTDDLAAMGDLDITDSLTLSGAGASTTIIRGTAGWADRIVYITSGDVVTMTSLTLREGASGGNAGGGLRNHGTLTLIDSILAANSAISGGGLANFGNLTLNRVTISGNTAAQSGGGIYNAPSGTLTINDSAVLGNSTASGANDGGGIANNTNNSLTLNNTTLSGNTASGDGGGIANLFGALALNNVTLSGNTADSDGGDNGSGGGLYVDFGPATAQNSLIGGNADLSASIQHSDCSGPLVSGGYNLLSSSAGCALTGTLTGNVLNVDPRLSPLIGVSYGLLPGSPAIDAGSPALPGSGGNACLAADQRGLPRPRVGLAGGSARCDIGALELRTFLVNNPTDAVDASPGNDLCATSLGECTLRGAIMETNGLPGLDHVVVPFGTYSLAINPSGGNDAASGDLNVTSDLALIGDGAAITIIQGSGGWLERLFRIEGVYAQISGVTIRNGGRNFSTGTNCASAAGGGLCNSGTLTILDNVIRDNRGLSNGGGGLYNVGTLAVLSTTVMNNPIGGGIYSVGTLTLANSQVLSNTAGSTSVGGIYSEGTLLIRDSLIASNTIPTASGGGIIAWTGSATLINTLVRSNSACCWGGGLVSIAAAVTISRSAFLSNTASDGGGLYSQVGAAIVESAFSDNLAKSAGGALKITGGTLTLDRSTLSGNIVTGTTVGGGAIMAGSSVVLVVTNTTLSGNNSAYHGGGLYLSGGSASFNNVTITDNQADSDDDGAGDGGGVWVAPSGAILNIRNTLLAGNVDLSALTRHPDCSGPLASQGYNLLGDDTGCALTPVLGDQVGTAANPIDPRLGLLQDNGGRTSTHALLPGSPAIDHGPISSCLPDQRGITRPQGAACDVGAYEFVPVTVSAVGIAGPSTGLVGTTYVFTATVSLISATLPITYVWRAIDQAPQTHTGSGISNTATFNWPSGGVKAITVTASNSAGIVTATHIITIVVAPSSLAINAPATGAINTSYRITATVSPISATLPITYVWRAIDQSPQTHTGSGISNTATFNWPSGGVKAITVTASNSAGIVTATHIITIVVAPSSLAINAPTIGDINTSYRITATVSPISATLPFTYTWRVTDYGVAFTVHNQGLNQTQIFNWSALGVKTIVVTATNGLGTVVDTHFITIVTKVYLPLVLKNF